MRRNVVVLYGKSFALLIVALAASFIIIEALLRLTGAATVGVMTALEGDYERIPGVFQPGQRVVDRQKPALRHTVSINSLGFRGTEPGGGRTVLCVGDSNTFGAFVNDDETLPARLAFEWQDRVSVLNAGVGGTTIVDHLEIVRKALGHGVRPALVVLMWSENDISDLALGEPLFTSIARNRRWKSGPVAGPIFGALRQTALFNFALHVRGWASARSTAQAGGTPAEADALWTRYDTLLGEFAAEVSDMVFVIFPSHYRLEAVGDGRLERIESLARARGLRVVSLLPALRATGLGPSDLYLMPHDGHPSARGYAVAAEVLARELRGFGYSF